MNSLVSSTCAKTCNTAFLYTLAISSHSITSDQILSELSDQSDFKRGSYIARLKKRYCYKKLNTKKKQNMTSAKWSRS